MLSDQRLVFPPRKDQAIESWRIHDAPVELDPSSEYTTVVDGKTRKLRIIAELGRGAHGVVLSFVGSVCITDVPVLRPFTDIYLHVSYTLGRIRVQSTTGLVVALKRHDMHSNELARLCRFLAAETASRTTKSKFTASAELVWFDHSSLHVRRERPRVHCCFRARRSSTKRLLSI